MEQNNTYGKNETATNKLDGPSDRIAFYSLRIEERNRLISEKRNSLISKELEIKKERQNIDQFEDENKQDYSALMRELSIYLPAQIKPNSLPGLQFDWNSQYNLDVFFNLLTGEIPRIPIVLFPMEREDFKMAFTLGSTLKSNIDCKDLKLFTDILYVLMRKGILLINEVLLVQTIMDRCLHRHKSVSKANLLRYISLSRCSFSRNEELSESVKIIISHLNRSKIES